MIKTKPLEQHLHSRQEVKLPQDSKGLRQTLHFCLDLVLLLSCFFPVLGPTLQLGFTALVLPLCLATTRFYMPRRWTRWQIPYESMKGILPGGLILVATTILGHLPPTPTYVSYALGCTVVIGWRIAFFKLFALSPSKRVLILSSAETGAQLAQEIESFSRGGYQLVGVVPMEGYESNEVPQAGSLLEVGSPLSLTVEAHGLDTIVIGNSELSKTMQQQLVWCLERGINVLTIPAMYERMTGRIPVDYIDGTWFASEVKVDERRLYAIGKRGLDILFASFGLCVTALLFPPIAIALKVFGGPGPVIYSQRRVGLHGHLFSIYKFRTMRRDAEKDGAKWAAQDDSRVTPIGKFLRQTRLDELPQFWNVLKGEMSMVGPRPERPEFTSLLEREIRFYNQRHMVPPGLTGWAQVMFSYGASVEDSFEKLQFDLYYIKNQSFFLDLTIMFKTAGVMIKKVGSR